MVSLEVVLCKSQTNKGVGCVLKGLASVIAVGPDCKPPDWVVVTLGVAIGLRAVVNAGMLTRVLSRTWGERALIKGRK